MRFGLLGPLTISRDGADVVVGSAQQRFVLAALLLEPGRVVSVDRLVDELWGEEIPKTARNVLQGCVAALRKALGVPIHHKPPGYLLDVDPESVDLVRFRDLAAKARLNEDVVLFHQALELWRGEPLADVPGLAAIRHALDEERLAVVEDCFELELRQGARGELIPALTLHIAQHPLRERLRGQLMTALHRAGRSAEATRTFHEFAQALGDELGTQPGVELRRLHEEILRAEAPEQRPMPRQLPSAPFAFAGRADELGALTRGGETVVISAIGGMGGVGKTWLALRWAHEHAHLFPDGQLFADLNGFAPVGEPLTPSEVLRGFLGALGVAPEAVPADPQAQAGLYRSVVADRRMLIVLDNARDADQVVPLLPGGRGCTVLITSRDRMYGLAATHGAHTLRLDVLTDDEALQVLVGRLGADRVRAEPEAVAALLRHCAGLPLALGVVAARAAAQPGFPLAALAAELDDGLLPDDGLAAVLSWSRRTLTPWQDEVFGLLGHAPGPDLSLAAAAGLLDRSTAETRAVLRALERASLLDEHAPGRYRMHDLVRAHAAQTEWNEAAQQRLVDFYLHTAANAAQRLNEKRTRLDLPGGVRALDPSDVDAAYTWFQAESANLLAVQQAAADHGWHERVWQLAWTLHLFQNRRGRTHDMVLVWQRAARSAAAAQDERAQAEAHQYLGHAFHAIEEFDEALRHLRLAAEAFERIGNAHGQVHTYGVMSAVYEHKGDFEQALTHATRSWETCRTIDEPLLLSSSRNAMGWYASLLGDLVLARVCCEDALELCRTHGFADAEAETLNSLAHIEHQAGRSDQALQHVERAIALRRQVGNGFGEATDLDEQARIYAALGRVEDARRSWRQALGLFEALGRTHHVTQVRAQLDGLT